MGAAAGVVVVGCCGGMDISGAISLPRSPSSRTMLSTAAEHVAEPELQPTVSAAMHAPWRKVQGAALTVQGEGLLE